MAIVEQFKIVGHLGGITNCVRVHGTRLFCSFGPELAIFEISTPEQAEHLGSILLGEMNVVSCICATDNYAYVTVWSDTVPSNGALFVVDISSVEKPRAVGYLSPRLPPSAAVYAGGYVYLAVRDDGLFVVDVSEPTFPFIVSRYKPNRIKKHVFPRVQDVLVANHHVYLRSGGLHVLNVSDPRSIKFTSYIDLPLDGFAATDDLLVTVGNGVLTVFDISPSAQPVALGRYQVDDWWDFVEDVAIHENLVAVIGLDEGGEGYLRLFDITVPAKPRYLSALSLPGRSVVVGEKHVYAASMDRGGIVIADVFDRRRPSVCGGWLTAQVIDTVLVEGEIAYIAGADACYTLDMNDPLHPVALGFYSSTRAVHGIDVMGTTACLAEGPLAVDAIARDGVGGGLRILDIANPRRLESRGFYSVDDIGTPYDVAIQDSTAYLLCGVFDYETQTSSEVVLRFDISDPAEIQLTGKEAISAELFFRSDPAGIWESDQRRVVPETVLLQFDGVQLSVDGHRLSLIPGRTHAIRDSLSGTLARLPGLQKDSDLVLEAAGSRGLFIRQPPPAAQLPHQLHLPLG